MIHWDRDADGIVTLTFDDPNSDVNTMNDAYQRAMGRTLDRLESESDSLTGVILTSAKKTFFAGGDLERLLAVRPDSAAAFMTNLTEIKTQLRRLERLGRPVVAACGGSALGGGLEIALACHHRIALSTPDARFGFPEVTLGLLPGAGGLTRTVRRLGIAEALLKVLIKGPQLSATRMRELGLIEEIADDPAEMIRRAKAFITSGAPSGQPWDAPGHRIPGGTPASPKLAATLPAFPANLRRELKGAPYPAPHHILCAAVEGAQVDFDTALLIESRYLTDLVTQQTSKNMTKAFFFDLRHVNGGGSRPSAPTPHRPTRIAVLGAGMMGAGIAYVCAKAGFEVVLKDLEQAAADRGRAYSANLLDRALAKGRITAERHADVLSRITATDDYADVKGAEVLIEAVFEDPAVKHRVYAEAIAVAPEAMICSNTSTLPITMLAEAVPRPADFIGLHFFSPVDKMPLVEIIRGAATSDDTLARAHDIVRAINKTPIVVNDSRGFFTSRVIGTYVNEGLTMLAEGIDPSTIEQASLQAGYPTSVLRLVDELTLTLPRRIRQETRRAVEAEGGVWRAQAVEAVLDRMIDEFSRRGRSSGAGFYDYEDGRRGGLWPGLREHFVTEEGRAAGIRDFTDLSERMLFVEALETVRCFDEGVLTSIPDANIGSILGIGFPAWTGGVIQYILGYPGGPAGFVARCAELTERYGDRFIPPASLVEAAERGVLFPDAEPRPRIAELATNR